MELVVKKNISEINFYQFSNLGHFCYSDIKTDKFPELLDLILK